jgi:hypothetical protein
MFNQDSKLPNSSTTGEFGNSLDINCISSSNIHINDSLLDDAYNNTKKRRSTPFYGISRPSRYLLKKLKKAAPELFGYNLHPGARDRYDLNWLSYEDHILNWEVLSSQQRENLEAIAEGDWDEKLWTGGGLKCGNNKDLTFPEALMLLTSVDIGEVVGGAGHKIVRGNIRRNGKYPMGKSSRRMIDPRAAKTFNYKWIKRKDLSSLFTRSKAKSLVVPYPDGLVSVGDNALSVRDDINGFFKKVHSLLVGWVESKKNPACAFIQSSEISCRSIRKSQFNPHVHILLWIKKDYDFSFLDLSEHQGLKFLEGGDEISTASRAKSVISYISKSTSLVEPYRREFSERDITKFNLMTVEAHHTLSLLYSGAANDEPSRGMSRKFLTRGVPNRKKTNITYCIC